MNYLGIEKSLLNLVGLKLNVLLASYNIYYQNLRSFHWHISGQNFFELHRVFEELYNDAKIKIDDIAERVVTLRLKPLGSMSSYLKYSEIEESPDQMNDRLMVKNILGNHATLIALMREVMDEATNAKDEATIDMIGGFLSNLEKKSWMLDAWSQDKLYLVDNTNHN